MNVLVFGASGKTGREVVARSLAKDYHVTAFCRSAAKLGLKHEKLRIEQGDVADEAAVRRVMTGHDAVVSTLGVGTPFTHDQAVIDGVRHIVAAAQAAGVKRLVYLSTLGVADSRAESGFIHALAARYAPIKHEIRDHELKEPLVTASSLDWTIVRAPAMTNGRFSGRVRAGLDIRGTLLPMLSRADVAEFVVQQLADPTYSRKAARLLPA